MTGGKELLLRKDGSKISCEKKLRVQEAESGQSPARLIFISAEDGLKQ
jgi:hypothetical protein